MTRSYFKFSIPLFLLFFIPLALSRALPYDDQNLRAAVMPQDCQMPCFMGIRPGITTVEEAVRLLRASPWVDKVTDDANTLGTNAITWTWSPHKPSFIKDRSSGLLLAHTTDAQINVVDIVRIKTTVSVGDMALLWINDTAPIVSGPNGPRNEAYMQTTDYQNGVRMWSAVHCPVTKLKFLDTQATLDFGSQNTFSAGESDGFVRPESYWCWRHSN